MAAIKVGTSDISAVYVGSSPVSKIYVGTTQVWPAQSASFSIDPTSLTGRTNSSGTATITFSQGVSNYVFISSPAWVTVTEIVSSNLTTGLTVSYTANTGSQRSGNIEFSAGGSTFAVAISQSATSTVSVTGVSLNKTSTTITAGSTEQLAATITPSNATNQNVTWSSSNSSVATVSSSGLVTAVAAGSATITVRTNDGNYTATCTATIAAATSVTTELNYVGLGGTDYIYITGSLSYWQIDTSTAPDWISYDASYGTTSPIAIRAASNETGSARIGTLRLNVNGTLYTVAINQAKIVAHLFKINPTPADATVLIDGQQRTNNQAYFAPTAEIPWEVSKTGYVTQSGTLTMGYTDYTMDVTLIAATYTLSVSPTSCEFDYDEYSSSSGKSISITSNQSWTISVPTGFAISRSTSGSGNATFNVYPTSNNSGTTNKTGTLTITGNDSQFVNVQLTQKALILTIDPTELNVSASGGSYSVSVGDPNNYGWTISSNQSWCSVEPSSGTGNATVAVGIGTNTSSIRSATITLASSTGDGTNLTCSVAQAAAQAITFSPSSVSFAGTGSEEVIGVNGTFDWWEVTSWPNWCTCEMTTGQSNNPILIEASANTGSTTRTGTLVVEVDGVEYQIPLSQVAASAVTYNFIVSASPSGCTVLINDSVRTNNTFACPAGTEVRWSVSKTGYVTQSGTYTMTAENHTETITLVAATLSVSLSGGSGSSSITIPTFAYDADSYSEGASFYINANQPWTLTKPSWCTIYGNTTSGSGTAILRVYPSSINSGSSARTGTITVTGTYGGTATVNLTQERALTIIKAVEDGYADNEIMQYGLATYTVDPLISVTWSIDSGSNICSIDVEDGLAYVTITDGAEIGDQVTIRATSTTDSTKYATLTITVVEEQPLIPDSIAIDTPPSGFEYSYGSYSARCNSATFTATTDPQGLGGLITWELRTTSGGTWTDTNKISIQDSVNGGSGDVEGLLTVTSAVTGWTSLRVYAISTIDSTVYDYINIVVDYGD